MAREKPYEIVYTRETKQHFRVIPKKHHSAIFDEIEERLSRDPLVPDMNKREMRSGTLPRHLGIDVWRLRLGLNNAFRALYRVDEEERLVEVLAIGVKINNRYFFGGEEWVV